MNVAVYSRYGPPNAVQIGGVEKSLRLRPQMQIKFLKALHERLEFHGIRAEKGRFYSKLYPPECRS